MLVEVSVAVNCILTNLYNKLPRRRVDMFGEELDKCIKAKCQGHWFPDQPMKSAAHRCLRVSGEHTDQVMFQAARESGMDISEIFSCLPDDLTLWIDPGQVSCRMGDKGLVRVLYSENNSQSPAASDYEPERGISLAQGQPDLMSSLNSNNNNSMSNHSEPVTPGESNYNQPPPFRTGNDNLSASFGQMSLSPAMAGINPASCWSTTPSPTNVPIIPAGAPFQSYLQKSLSTPNFTAASFAQTKFGSTKLKTQAKRQNRLSPSDLGPFMMGNQQITPPPGMGQCPQQLSPVGPAGYQSSAPFVNRSLSMSPSIAQNNHPGFDVSMLMPQTPEITDETSAPINPGFAPVNVKIPPPGLGRSVASPTGNMPTSQNSPLTDYVSTLTSQTNTFGAPITVQPPGSPRPSDASKDHDSVGAGTPNYQQMLLAN